MTRLGKLIAQFLERMDWHDEIEEDEPAGRVRLETRIRVAGQSCRLHVEASERSDSIALVMYPPFRVVEGQYAEACMLVNAINHRSRHGRFEIDPSDGELRFVVSADVEGAEPTGQFIVAMLNIANWMLERWLGELAAVSLSGRKAAEVLEASELRTAGEDFGTPASFTATGSASRLLN